ncbi:MAG TPA: acetyltransferase [Roseiflexaceae bacterium]|nr:acetyltransferase [Roseiflexaceae bacterium]
MQQVLILGAGGHAQVVADILLRARDAGAQIEPIGYLDDNPELRGQARLGLPILGCVADVSRLAHDALIVGIGDNHARRCLFERFEQHGERFAVARHPAAIIAPDVPIGRGATICAGAVINPGGVIGANTILNTGCTVDHHTRVDDHAHVAPGAHLGGDTSIGEGALIGIGATVMPQRHVGGWSVVGAGALVHANVPDRVVVVGVPARLSRPT